MNVSLMLRSSTFGNYEKTLGSKLHSPDCSPAKVFKKGSRVYLIWAKFGNMYAEGYAEFYDEERTKIRYVITI